MKTLNKRQLLKLDLQYFAEPEEEPTEKIELSEEELQKRIESESDKKLAKVLEKKQQEFERKQEEAIQKALEEHQRLSKLSEKERQDAELTKREQEIADREADIKRKELRADAINDLTEKKLPTNFVDFLLADDSEKTLENINTFKTSFEEAVNNAVKEALRQETPSSGGGQISSGKINLSDLAREARVIK